MLKPRQIILTICSIFLLSCTDNEALVTPPELVVEGWIEDGGFPTVILTHSLTLSRNYQSADDLEKYIIKWARVTVSDGEDTVVLTGMYDKGYYPPYVYTTGQLRGEAGKTYHLTVDYHDYHASAVTTIPSAPENVSFHCEQHPERDTLFTVRTSLRNNPDTKEYYQLFSRVGGENKQYLASFMGTVDDVILDTGMVEFPLYRGHEIRNKQYTPYFVIGDTLSVKVARIDEVSYRFWDELTKQLSNQSSLFISTNKNISSNIEGGQGYWCGYGAVTAYFIIPDIITTY